MKDAGVLRKRPLSALLIFIHSLFLLETILPQAVWCHKPDGRIAVEFEVAASPCPCDDCERCRELNLVERLDRQDGGLLWEPAHCVHDPIHSEAVRSSSFVPGQDPPALDPLVMGYAACIQERPLVLSSIPTAPLWPVAPEPPPPGDAVRRC